MSKLWVVARREYRTTVRTKAFVVAIVLVPIFMGGGIMVQALTRGRIDADDKRIAVLDRSGKLFATLEEAAAKRNEEIVDKNGKLTDPRFVLEAVPVDEAELEAQRLELSDRVRKKSIFAFVEVDPGIVEPGETSGPAALKYYSNQPTYEDVHRWLSRVVNDRIRAVRFSAAGLDKALVERAMTPVPVENLGLMEKDASTGEVHKARPVNPVQTFVIPLAIVMLMWMSLMMTTQPILSGVIEEKMQKISEVLLGSVRPFDLMFGKLLGFVGVAVTLVGIYLVGGWTVANYFNKADMIPMDLVGWFGLFMALAIFMFGSLFLAAGACCNELREAQNLVMPIWLLLLIPMFTLGPVLQHPSSNFAVGLSLFPPATPIVMMVRMALPPGVPMWQVLVGIAGTSLTTLVFVWAAGRVFRVGLLMQGKPPKPTEIIRWVFRG